MHPWEIGGMSQVSGLRVVRARGQLGTMPMNISGIARKVGGTLPDRFVASCLVLFGIFLLYRRSGS